MTYKNTIANLPFDGDKATKENNKLIKTLYRIIRLLSIIIFSLWGFPSLAADPTIKKDFLDLLTHTKEAHVSKYMYNSKEDYFGKLIAENPGYYILREEIDIINNFLDIGNFFKDAKCHVIEFGPGDNQAVLSKTVPVLQQIPHLASYHAIDIREIYATAAIQKILQKFPHIKVSHQISDFLKNLCIQKANLILFLGGTIHNFTHQELESLFKSFRENLENDGYVLITVDTNQDPKSLQQAYDHPYSHALALSCLSYFKKKLSLSSFDEKSFQCAYEWHPETHEVKLFLRSLHSQTLQIDNRYIKLNKNEKFHVFSSRKFQDKDIVKLANNHHFDVKTSFCASTARVKIYLLQKK